MIKSLLLIVFLFFSSLIFSQSFGKYKLDVEGYDSEVDGVIPKYEVWLADKDGGIYSMYFPQTPIGLKHLKETIEEIFHVNGYKDVPEPLDKSYIGNDIEDEDDFTEIHNSVMKGNSEIKQFWESGAVLLQLFIVKDGYEIHFINLR